MRDPRDMSVDGQYEAAMDCLASATRNTSSGEFRVEKLLTAQTFLLAGIFRLLNSNAQERP